MTDLIRRDDAIEAVRKVREKPEKYYTQYNAGVDCSIKALSALPSAEAVQVVRCGECKNMIADGRCMEFADDGIRPSATDFCSYGERKGGGEE